MPPRKTKTSLSKLTWAVILMVVIVPIIFASTSPLLAWRDPIYIVAGFAGILAMSLLFIQPLAIGGDLPNLHPIQQRRLHRWGGSLLFVLIVLHVVGLWITSPPDMIDALLFSAPTLFSYFGVIAMWAIFAAAILAFLRKRLAPRNWRKIHFILVAIIITTSTLHAVMIEGTMEPITKVLLCVFVALMSAKVIGARLWK